MAGELKFALQLTDEDRAAEVLTRLDNSIASIAQKAARTSAPLTSSANSVRALERGARSTTASLRAMENVFAAFGGQLAPQMTAGILTVSSSMQALKATATATGASLASIGVAAGGAVAILATLTVAIDYAKAKLAEGDSESNLIQSLRQQADALQKQIQDLARNGKLTKDEAIGLQVKLALAPNAVQELESALRDVRKRLRDVLPLPTETLDSLDAIKRRVAADNLSGRDRVTAELDISVIEFTKNLENVLGGRGDLKDSEFQNLINDFARGRRKQLEEQFFPDLNSSDKTTAEKVNRVRTNAPDNLTGLERLGLIINSGAGGGRASDPGFVTAENTRQMLAVNKQILQVLSRTGLFPGLQNI